MRPGSNRSMRCRSASLPVFTTPSSASIAPAEVTTQSGHGSGPRWLGWMLGQVDHRWSPRGSTMEKARSVEASSDGGNSECKSVAFENRGHRMRVLAGGDPGVDVVGGRRDNDG